MATVRVNPAFKQQMGRPENSRRWQAVAGPALREAIAAQAPVRFGTLRATLFVRVVYSGGTTHIWVGSLLKYAAFQEVGTGLYGPLGKYITPKRAKALSWLDTAPGRPGGPAGLRRYAKRVKGSPPVLFFFKGTQDVFGAARTTSYAASGGTSPKL